MEQTLPHNNNHNPVYQDITSFSNRTHPNSDTIENNSVYKKLASEGCENFFNYMEWLGLSKDPNIIVLSSSHHYFYDNEELKDINTMINLKLLNQISSLKSFLHSIYHILPQRCFYIGCFYDNKIYNRFFSSTNVIKHQNSEQTNLIEKGIESRIPILNFIYSIMDSKTNKFLTNRNVNILLEERGLKVLDMTEFEGLTYFCVQKNHPAV